MVHAQRDSTVLSKLRILSHALLVLSQPTLKLIQLLLVSNVQLVITVHYQVFLPQLVLVMQASIVQRVP